MAHPRTERLGHYWKHFLRVREGQRYWCCGPMHSSPSPCKAAWWWHWDGPGRGCGVTVGMVLRGQQEASPYWVPRW